MGIIRGLLQVTAASSVWERVRQPQKWLGCEYPTFPKEVAIPNEV